MLSIMAYAICRSSTYSVHASYSSTTQGCNGGTSSDDKPLSGASSRRLSGSRTGGACQHESGPRRRRSRSRCGGRKSV